MKRTYGEINLGDVIYTDMDIYEKIIECADKIDRYEYILNMDDLSIIERKYWRQQYSFYKWYLNIVLGVEYKNE